MVSTGDTGHAESVKVIYDPSLISFDKILQVFFSVAHDPTELNRQGPDVGTQYRSAIFYTTDDQKNKINAFINKLNRENIYPNPIVTEVKALNTFYSAEAYHQNYAQQHPLDPYIYQYDRPKLENLSQKFPELYRQLTGK